MKRNVHLATAIWLRNTQGVRALATRLPSVAANLALVRSLGSSVARWVRLSPPPRSSRAPRSGSREGAAPRDEEQPSVTRNFRVNRFVATRGYCFTMFHSLIARGFGRRLRAGLRDTLYSARVHRQRKRESDVWLWHSTRQILIDRINGNARLANK